MQSSEEENMECDDVNFQDQSEEETISTERTETTELNEDQSQEIHNFMIRTVTENNIRFIDKLLDEPFSDINITQFGESLLMIAIRKGHEDMARFLIENGINYNAVKVLFKDEENEVNNLCEQIPNARYDWYTMSCRELAYEKEMISIVEIIDFLNGDLYSFQNHPEVIIRDRSVKRGMFNSVVSLREEFFETTYEESYRDLTIDDNSSLKYQEQSTESSIKSKTDSVPTIEEIEKPLFPAVSTRGNHLITQQTDENYLGPKLHLGGVYNFSGFRQSYPNKCKENNSDVKIQPFTPRETKSSLLRRIAHGPPTNSYTHFSLFSHNKISLLSSKQQDHVNYRLGINKPSSHSAGNLASVARPNRRPTSHDDHDSHRSKSAIILRPRIPVLFI